jgi:phage shock protein A
MAKGIFSRMTDIVKSNINELLDRAEEPEKMIRQMVCEMEEAVNKTTASVGTAVANQKRLERQYNEKNAQIAEWQRKAEKAVEAGNDGLARRALERKGVFQKAADDLQPALEESVKTADQLRDQLRELKTKLEEARTRHRAAEARKRLAQSISGLGNDAFSSFERFEQKIESSEAEADAHTEVAGDMEDIEKEVRNIEQKEDVEDELSALKARVSQKKTKK